MREILFRGQTRKKGQKVWIDGTPVDGEWVYGGVLQGVGAFSIIYGSKNQNDPGEDLQKWCVYSDTLGQFTGLTDKNGKKIFEGDIVKAKASHPCGGDVIGTVVVSLDDYELMWDLDHSHEIEIIGNIHDNPELIRSEEYV